MFAFPVSSVSTDSLAMDNLVPGVPGVGGLDVAGPNVCAKRGVQVGPSPEGLAQRSDCASNWHCDVKSDIHEMVGSNDGKLRRDALSYCLWFPCIPFGRPSGTGVGAGKSIASRLDASGVHSDVHAAPHSCVCSKTVSQPIESSFLTVLSFSSFGLFCDRTSLPFC